MRASGHRAEPDDARTGSRAPAHGHVDRTGHLPRGRARRKIPVPTDEAYDLVYELKLPARIIVDQSRRGAVCGRVAQLDDGVVVAIFPDFGDRYLSTNLWAGWEEWQRQHRNG
jgi:hypothetical protein